MHKCCACIYLGLSTTSLCSRAQWALLPLKIIEMALFFFANRPQSPQYIRAWIIEYSLVRGGVIIKKQENLGQCLKFNFGHLKTHGGVLDFSKMSQFQIGTFEDNTFW